MRKAKQFISVFLCILLSVSSFVISVQAKDTRKYVKSISVKKKATVTIPAGKKKVVKTFKVTVKVNGKASKKFTAKSGKKSVAAVKVSGKKIKVTAKKAGKVKIKITTKAKSLKKKKLSKTLTLTVKKAKKTNNSKNTTPTSPAVDPTAAPTAEPTIAPETSETSAVETQPQTETAAEETQEETQEESEPYHPAEIDPENFDITLKYSDCADNSIMGFARIGALSIISYDDDNAEYTFKIADEKIVNISQDEDGEQFLTAAAVGKTTVEYFEQFPGQEKRNLGTVTVTVEKATMADAAEGAFQNYENDEYYDVKLKMNLNYTSFEVDTILRNAVNGSENTGTNFKDDEYTLTYESDDEKVAVVSDKGVISGVKNGEATVTCIFTFPDNSTYEEYSTVTVKGAAIEHVDGYTIDNVRDYIVGVDTPVELSDGTKTPLINFDNAATTPAFKAVQDAVNRELEMYGSIGRGFSQKSNHSTDIYNSTRDKVLDFFTADPDLYTCFYVNSTTDGLNKLASALVNSKDDIVLTTRIEHHANDLSWRERCKVIYAEVDEKGRVIYDDIEKLLKENKVKIVSISAASNVTGYVNDVHRVAKMAHKYGAKIVVDGAQIVAHRKFYMMGDLDDPDDDIDFIAFSAHKMYSPYGGGAVLGLTEVLNENMPEFYGGGTIKVVGDDWQVYKDAPAAYEAGSPNYPGVVGLGKAIDVLSTIGLDKIEAHEKVLNRKLIDGLKKLPNIILYGDCENIDDRVGVITFNFSDINTMILAEQLSGLGGVATRRGAFCAHPYVWRLMGIDDETVHSFENCTDANTAGMIRVSFGIYNNEQEIDKLLELMPKAMQAAKDANPNGEANPEY